MSELEIRWFCDECEEHCFLMRTFKPKWGDCKKGNDKCKWIAIRYISGHDGIEVNKDYIEWLRTHGTLKDMIMWKEELLDRGYYTCSLGIPCNRCEEEDCQLPEEVR